MWKLLKMLIHSHNSQFITIVWFLSFYHHIALVHFQFSKLSAGIMSPRSVFTIVREILVHCQNYTSSNSTTPFAMVYPLFIGDKVTSAPFQDVDNGGYENTRFFSIYPGKK